MERPVTPSNGLAAVQPFAVKDVTLLAIATGRRAQTLRELRDHLRALDAETVYHHFWGRRLRPRFDDVEYNNDFAAWAEKGLHDALLAERLGVIDPATFADLDELHQYVLELIEQRLHEQEFVPWSKPDRQFHFLRSQMIIFDTGLRIHRPEELPDVLPQLSPSSIFYHVVDARRRHPLGLDDFRAWLVAFGDRYRALEEELGAVDPYFLSLEELGQELASVCHTYFQEVAS